MNTTTHRKNTNTETKIPEHGTQHVTSPRSSRDGLRYGNEKVCEHSRIATSAPPHHPGETKRATVDSAVPPTDRTTFIAVFLICCLLIFGNFFYSILFLFFVKFIFLNSFYLDQSPTKCSIYFYFWLSVRILI